MKIKRFSQVQKKNDFQELAADLDGQGMGSDHSDFR